MLNKLAQLKNVLLYGLFRLKSKELQDEYSNWLSLANAGMMNKGNIYCVDFALQHLPSTAPIVEIGCFCGRYNIQVNHRF